MRISGLANMDAASTGDLRRKAKLRLLQMHYESGVGHLGEIFPLWIFSFVCIILPCIKTTSLYCRRAMVRVLYMWLFGPLER